MRGTLLRVAGAAALAGMLVGLPLAVYSAPMWLLVLASAGAGLLVGGYLE